MNIEDGTNTPLSFRSSITCCPAQPKPYKLEILTNKPSCHVAEISNDKPPSNKYEGNPGKEEASKPCCLNL